MTTRWPDAWAASLKLMKRNFHTTMRDAWAARPRRCEPIVQPRRLAQRCGEGLAP